MKPLQAYFHGEKVESAAFLGAGVAAVIAALIWILALDSSILFGASWALLFIGLAHIMIGGTIYLRTPAQVARLEALAQKSGEMFRIEELERMERVEQNFLRMRWIEIALFIVSGIMLFIFFPTKGPWLGFAVALLFESALSLVLDFFAEERADHYVEFVKRVA